MPRTKLTTRQDLRQDGWHDIVINGVDCVRIVHPGDYQMIAQWSRSGYTSRQAARRIQAQLGPALCVHTLTEAGRERITTLEYPA